MSGDLLQGNIPIINGFVAQISLWVEFPFPQTDLAYGDSTRYAKSCEAV